MRLLLLLFDVEYPSIILPLLRNRTTDPRRKADHSTFADSIKIYSFQD